MAFASRAPRGDWARQGCGLRRWQLGHGRWASRPGASVQRTLCSFEMMSSPTLSGSRQGQTRLQGCVQGGTRKKIERSSGSIVQYVGQVRGILNGAGGFGAQSWAQSSAMSNAPTATVMPSAFDTSVRPALARVGGKARGREAPKGARSRAPPAPGGRRWSERWRVRFLARRRGRPSCWSALRLLGTWDLCSSAAPSRRMLLSAVVLWMWH